MSTAPIGWQDPKTDWASPDIVHPSDFNRIEGNTRAIEEGQRTLDPTQEPTSNTGTLRQILDWLVNRIWAITGMANWWEPPPCTLADVATKLEYSRFQLSASIGGQENVTVEPSKGHTVMQNLIYLPPNTQLVLRRARFDFGVAGGAVFRFYSPAYFDRRYDSSIARGEEAPNQVIAENTGTTDLLVYLLAVVGNPLSTAMVVLPSGSFWVDLEIVPIQ